MTACSDRHATAPRKRAASERGISIGGVPPINRLQAFGTESLGKTRQRFAITKKVTGQIAFGQQERGWLAGEITEVANEVGLIEVTASDRDIRPVGGVAIDCME